MIEFIPLKHYKFFCGEFISPLTIPSFLVAMDSIIEAILIAIAPSFVNLELYYKPFINLIDFSVSF